MKRVPRILPLLRGLGLVVGLGLLSAACSQAPPPAPWAVEGLAPWEVPAEAYGRQLLFRAHYDGPDATGGFHLTLRLAEPGRFQARAVHSLGKKLWSLDVADGRALFLDHRAKVFCTLGDRPALRGSPLGAMPLRAFPAVLLGRLPEEPTASPRRSGDEMTFRGEQDRRWRVTLGEAGRIERWILEEDGEPTVWWDRRDGEPLLSDRARGVQLSWRQVVSEPLVEPPDALTPPDGYRAAECAELDLSVDDSI